MIRPALLAAVLATLAGCDTPTPFSGADELVLAEPVEVMDPGEISCTSIATAVDGRYIDAATIWAGGQYRAAILRGDLPGPAPQDDYDEGIATFISDYCRTYSGATARDAFNAIVAG